LITLLPNLRKLISADSLAVMKNGLAHIGEAAAKTQNEKATRKLQQAEALQTKTSKSNTDEAVASAAAHGAEGASKDVGFAFGRYTRKTVDVNGVSSY
jgi:hypothetical protein